MGYYVAFRYTPRVVSRAVTLCQVLNCFAVQGHGNILSTAVNSIPGEKLEPLREVAARLGASLLNDLLAQGAEADHLLEERTTLPERRELLRALVVFQDQVPRSSQHAWDPRPQINQHRPPPLPDDPVARREWFIDHDLGKQLFVPLIDFMPWLATAGKRERYDLPLDMSLGEFLGIETMRGRGLGNRRQTIDESIHQALKRGLAALAARESLRRHRAVTWNEAPSEPRLSRLAETVRACHMRLEKDPGAQKPVSPDQPTVFLGVDPPTLCFSTAGRPRSRMNLQGFNPDEFLARHGGSPEARVLIEWCLDVIHEREHPLHGPMLESLSPGGHGRLLTSLERIVIDVGLQENSTEDRRIVWRIAQEKGEWGVAVEPAIQRRSQGGAWTKGQRVEAESLTDSEEFDRLLTPEDHQLAYLVSSGKDTDATTRSAGLKILRVLARHPFVFNASSRRPIRVVEDAPVLRVEALGDGVELALALGGRVWTNATLNAVLQNRLRATTVALLSDDAERLTFCPLDATLRGVIEVLCTNGSFVARREQERLLVTIMSLQPAIRLDIPTGIRGEERKARVDLVLQVTPLDDASLDLELLSRPLGEAARSFWPPGRGPELDLGEGRDGRVSTRRDLERELQIAEAVEHALDLARFRRERPHVYRVDELDRALSVLEKADDLLRRTADDDSKLQAVVWPEDVKPWRVARVGVGDLRVQIERKRDWFAIQGAATANDASIPLGVLLRAARTGRRYVPIGQGQFAEIRDALRERLLDAGRAITGDEEGMSIASALVEEALRLVEDPEYADMTDETAKLVEQIRRAKEVEHHPPTDFGAELRAYQTDGVRWILQHAALGTGVCLADEMGLGKTVQTLAVLTARAQSGPALVVAPTSVCAVWRDQCVRFAPALRPVIYRDSGRHHLLESVRAGTLLITSYDIVLRDAEALSGRGFATLVLDEAQTIKNAKTQRAKAVRQLNAAWKLALTGTPIENHLGDLWSLFHAINPGLLGSWETFQLRFARPIEAENCPRARTDLRALVQQFVLRRTKKKVALELPERIEVLREVELSSEEMHLYEDARRRAVEELDAGVNETTAVFRHLTRLRQLACHPRLVDAASPVPSSKLESFLELARDLVEEDHRTLVFSALTSAPARMSAHTAA